jgi:hypothetical protein
VNPHQRITPVRKLHKFDGESSEEDVTESVRDGDRRLSEINRARGMLLPEEGWPAALTRLRYEVEPIRENVPGPWTFVI